MATQILAVDDSATMRKILEITFTGSEFNVVTVASADAALSALRGDAFAVVISDITLDPNGYDLCRQIKAASPKTPVILLSSRQNPYDAAQGSASGADDHIDKPFDTQQLIDRVQKLARDGASAGPGAPQPVATVSASAMRARTLVYGGPGPAVQPPGAPAQAAPGGSGSTLQSIQAQAQAPAPAAKPASTALGFGATAARAPQQPQTPAPAPVAAQPKPASNLAATRPVATPAVAAATASANGQFAARAAELGLSPAQVDAVTALSREIVERVVWEVVPVLAETLIKEEIARLTK